MDATQPLDIAGSMPLANTNSLESLRNLFLDEAEQKAGIDVGDTGGGSQQERSPNTTAIGQTFVEQLNGQSEVSAEALWQDNDISDCQSTASINSVHASLAATASTVQSAASGTAVSKHDLVNVLESFVNLIKNTQDLTEDKHFAVQNALSFDPHQSAPQKVTVHLDDKTSEVEELRCLLVEAQETIIRLLTDRVEDRARMSQLETELKLLPDLQNQADRALSVAMNTEDFRKELTKVKFELERVRLSRVRRDVEKNHRSWWRGVRGWMFKTKTT